MSLLQYFLDLYVHKSNHFVSPYIMFDEPNNFRELSTRPKQSPTPFAIHQMSKSPVI